MPLLGDIEKLVPINGSRGALSLQLEHHYTGIVSSGEQVHLRVSSDNPASVQVARERLERGPLVKIPYTNSLIFAHGQNEVLVGVEETGGSILEVAGTGINFPCLIICTLKAISMIEVPGVVAEPTTHVPELDQPVVPSGHNQWQFWVERDPVDTAVMALEHEFDHRFSVVDRIRLVRIHARYRTLH